MSRLIRDFDWASTSIGPIETWPQCLKTATGLLLHSPIPIVMLWGEPGVMIYNDGYSVFAGQRHPSLLGMNVREAWPEVADWNDNVMKVGLKGGTLTYTDQVLALNRTGVMADAWLDLHYSPVPDEQGNPAGVIAIVVETTARKLADEARNEAKDRLELALSAGRGVGTWEWDVQRDRVVADARFARLYGVDPERARQGAPLAEFFKAIHPGDVPRVQASVQHALSTGELFSEEYRLVQADGSIAWVTAEGRAVKGPDGTPLRLPGVTFDITERRENETRQAAIVALNDAIRDLSDAEEIAFASSRVLAEALDVSRAGYGTIDTAAETITIARDYNAPGVASIAGTLRFRDYGSYIEDIKSGITVSIPDVTQDPRTRDTADALKAISAASFINMPLMEQGQVVALVFVNNAAPRAWRESDMTLMREFAERVRDASERARSEAALRKREASLRELNADLERRVLEQARERGRTWQVTPDLLSVMTLDGMFESVNPAWTKTLGWSAEELTAVPYMSFVHPDDLNNSIEAFEQVQRGDPVLRFENRYRNTAGEWVWLSWVAVPIEEKVYCSARDITEQKKAQTELAETQEALRQSQKMEAVGQLTGGIAHDFNNLLTGISASLEMLERRIGEGKISAAERYIGMAQTSAKRAAALTQRLLAFSRRQTLDPRPVEANKLIAGVEDLIRRSVGPSVEVEVVGAAGLWLAKVDVSQLENALLNLALNARDAMPEGGRITIETANKWLDERAARDRDLPPGQYISVCVTDTGTGMTADVIERAFDPFFTTKPLGQGTGLGLSMIHGFVRQSGGQVRIYSELAKGTTMCLYFPRFIGEMDAADEGEAPATADTGHGETVLVIDDEPAIRMLIAEVLEESGYRVLEAVDGPTGLKILQSSARIDLLISDVGLPGGMNGRQVADAARLTRPKLKVLFVTGYAENAVVGNGHLDPGMQVITKPFAMTALSARVRDIMDGRD